jgi:hypothetical protein
VDHVPELAGGAIGRVSPLTGPTDKAVPGTAVRSDTFVFNRRFSRGAGAVWQRGVSRRHTPRSAGRTYLMVPNRAAKRL